MVFHMSMVNKPFKANLKDIREKLKSTREYHKYYTSGKFIESITDSRGFIKKVDENELEKMNEYVPVEPFHNFVDGLEDTAMVDKIGDKQLMFMLMPPAERGFIFLFKYNEQLRILKPYQGPGEKEVAEIASRGGIGPKVFAFGELWIAEEFVEGPELIKIYDRIKVETAGQIIGYLYGKMHKNGIAYAHHPHLTTNEGPRHIILKGTTPKIIDFGISKYTKNPEDLKKDLDEVLNYFKLTFQYKELTKIKKAFKKTYAKYKLG